jgi:hypothetical protein
MWAVSQAAPVRSVHVKTELKFGEGAACSSGGFAANAEVEGDTTHAANQQWFSRGVKFGSKVSGGAWSTVFSGCTGNAPEAEQREGADLVATVEELPEIRIEKPFITVNEDNNYELVVPGSTRDLVDGPHLEECPPEDVRPFSRVKVGKPILPLEDGKHVDHADETYNTLTKDNAKLTDELQKALDQGKDLVLCPGIFFLTKPLVIKS